MLVTLPHICKLLSFKCLLPKPIEACSVLACSFVILPIDLLNCLQMCLSGPIHNLWRGKDLSAVTCCFCQSHLCKCFQSASWQRSSSCGHGGQCLTSQPLVCRGQGDGKQRFGTSLGGLASQAGIGISCSF